MELGIGELIFIFVLALLLFGPKKLPEIGRTLAKAMNDFKAASNEFKSTLEAEVAKLEDETRLGETIESIRNPMQNLVARGQAMLTEVVSPEASRMDAYPRNIVIEATPVAVEEAELHVPAVPSNEALVEAGTKPAAQPETTPSHPVEAAAAPKGSDA